MQTATEETPIELVRETLAPVFVINLCASTTPVALAHPDSPELKRYTFFVTRRREEGRERFRLHMGYFDTLAQAEALLPVVREIYPAAWAGPAPDQRVPTPRPAPAGAATGATPPAAAPTAPAAAGPARAPEPSRPAPVTPAGKTRTSAGDGAPSLDETISSMRAVLAELGDEAPPRAAAAQPVKPSTRETPKPTPAAAAAAAQGVARTRDAVRGEPPTLQPVRAPLPRAPLVAPATTPAASAPPLSESQTLRLLEQPPVPDTSATASNIKVLTPEDTQTLRDIKLEQQQNAPASYAVQLMWGVQPIDMESLPHLAIFDAYTLYQVEGNRHGRRWYGLRLGFFSDPASAKQVALYVRSEYAGVAVVPVTMKEKNGAVGAAPAAAKAEMAPARPVPANVPTVKPLDSLPSRSDDLAGFELLPDDPPAPKRDLDDVAPARAAPEPPRATGKAPGKRAVARPRATAPRTLEETLEILGASTLTLDESREIINDSGLRKAPPKKEPRAGRFGRLLSRLSEKARAS